MSYNKNTGMYEGYIYKIYNDINDKIYIGQTIRTTEDRFMSHKYDARNKNDNMILHHAMNKYGEDKFHVCELCKIESFNYDELSKCLNDKEIYFINKNNSVRPNGYNISAGGNSATYFKNKIYQYDLNCTLLNMYDTVREASINTGIGESAIHKCLLHKSKTAGGYVFLREDEEPYKTESKETQVNQYSKNGVYIKTYNSILDASVILNIDKSNITNCCRGKRYKSVGGYKWYYADDPNQPDKSKIIN